MAPSKRGQHALDRSCASYNEPGQRLDKCLDTQHAKRMHFGWDDAKRKSNFSNHRLDFADVYPAFSDKAKVVDPDTRTNYGELRYNMPAKINRRICNITFTERSGVIWLISARKANQREQRRYAKR